jgi:NAD(P)H-hydrate epimerase
MFNPEELKKLYIPPSDSHKGQNGKLMVIGGSKLFHAASLWALTIASKIVDMVFYSSVPENNDIVSEAKKEFRNGIVVPRGKIKNYIEEADCVLIGPGLPRKDGEEVGDDDTKKLTEDLLNRFPDKKWVIDGGSLQVISPNVLPKNAILTPHPKEFEKLFGLHPTKENAALMAKKYGVIVLLKGEIDIVCSPDQCVEISGGNAGMTKGGTGDVLAGLVAALACKNGMFLAATAGSYINKKAGEELFKKVSYNFNASELVEEIPAVMKKLQN